MHNPPPLPQHRTAAVLDAGRLNAFVEYAWSWKKKKKTKTCMKSNDNTKELQYTTSIQKANVSYYTQVCVKFAGLQSSPGLRTRSVAVFWELTIRRPS
jgi:hypothetical protein